MEEKTCLEDSNISNDMFYKWHFKAAENFIKYKTIKKKVRIFFLFSFQNQKDIDSVLDSLRCLYIFFLNSQLSVIYGCYNISIEVWETNKQTNKQTNKTNKLTKQKM